MENENLAAVYKELKSMGSSLPKAFCNMVIRWLKMAGFEAWDQNSLWNLAFCIHSSETGVLDHCHIDSVPSGLYPMLCDRSCGRFLYDLKQTGSLEIATLNLGGILTSLTEGDVKIDFSKDASDEGRLDVLLQMMMESGRKQLACYRKIRF